MADTNRLIIQFIQPGPGGLPRGIAAAHPSGYPSLRGGVLAIDPLAFPGALDIACTLSWPAYTVDVNDYYPISVDVAAGSYQFEAENFPSLTTDASNIYTSISNLTSVYYTPVMVPGTGRLLRPCVYQSSLLETGNIQTWPDRTITQGAWRAVLTQQRLVFDLRVVSIILSFVRDGAQGVKRVWSAVVDGRRQLIIPAEFQELVGGVWITRSETDLLRQKPFSFLFSYEMSEPDPANMSPVGDFPTVAFNSSNMDDQWLTDGTSFEVVSATPPE